MADIEFLVAKITGKLAEGTLQWTAKGLKTPAVSGPFGNGYLPLGLYEARRNQLLDKPAGSSYCDPSKRCWMQPLLPQFSTTRTDLGIHPDGGTPGTEGCIGITDKDTKAWYDAFYAVSGATFVEVDMAADAREELARERLILRRPMVTVIGSGKKEHLHLAQPLGQLLAELGVSLLTGAGGGVMTAVARAFCLTPGREGLSIGIVPAATLDPWSPKEGYPSPWIDIPIFTHLRGVVGGDGTEPESRNHINVLSGAAVIALPGGQGTRAEANLARHYGKTVAVFAGHWSFEMSESMVQLNSVADVPTFVRDFVF